ncbi:MAG: NUDIX hydrolase [Propioniciclava sp.]
MSGSAAQVIPRPDGHTGDLVWPDRDGAGQPVVAPDAVGRAPAHTRTRVATPDSPGAAPPGDSQGLAGEFRAAATLAFDQGLGRVEAHVARDDRAARHALHQAGFRLEGRLRDGARDAEGLAYDVLLYARLATDNVDGRDGFTAVMNTVTPRKRLIAHALVTDQTGRVYLCETSFKPDWELPGGIVEPGESPRRACAREISEELGLDLQPGRLLVVDWLRPHLGWEDALEVVFATDPLTPAEIARITPDGTEILAVHALTLDEACTRVAPYAVGRLRAAWAASHTGRPGYLEDGLPTD